MRWFLGGFLIVMAGCGGNVPVDYRTQVQPLLQRQCIVCHNDEEKSGGISVTGYEPLMASRSKKAGRALVVVGKPDSSLLVEVLESANERRQMPPPGPGVRHLSAEEVRRIRQWIAEGARPAAN